jgi:hypothetical protein
MDLLSDRMAEVQASVKALSKSFRKRSASAQSDFKISNPSPKIFNAAIKLVFGLVPKRYPMVL